MTTDLGATSSEVVETNSLREVMLFCAVLLVEIYSLSVSFGGPFFEVGYFLLVVISQTFAGAYIWAQLRKSDKSLPLPELLAMGFAIGSASAAISQLIIRDLLGIRLFLSPLIPIIGVAIWLITKRDPQLPVKVTHATTNTLLWLLLPVPVTLMKNTIFLLPLYTLLLLAVLLISNKTRVRKLSLTTTISISISLVLIMINYIFSQINGLLSRPGLGIARIINDDIRTDIVNSIGFYTWGLNTNTELVNYTNAYYKLSHLWLGPIIESNGSLATNIATLIVPFYLILMIALALWTFTFRLSSDTNAAAVGALLFFAQADIQDNLEINFRFVWLLGAFYLITFGLITQHLIKQPALLRSLGLMSIGFIIAGTRITFFPMLVLVANAPSTLNHRSLRRILRDQINLLTTLSIGVCIALLVFVHGANSTLLDVMLLRASDWPISFRTSLVFVISSTVSRTFLFLGVIVFSKKYKLRFFIVFSFVTYLLSTLVVPRIAVYDTAFLFPFLLIITPPIAILISDAYKNLKLNRVNFGYSIVIGIYIGLIHKIIFDMYREKPPSENFLRAIQYGLSTNSLLLFASALICSTIFVLCQLGLLKLLRRDIFVAIFIITVIACNFGVLIGSSIRPITEYFRFGEVIWTREPDPLVARWSDPSLIQGLSAAKSLSNIDDNFASNFGLIRGTGPDDNLRLQLFIKRKLYVSSRYEYFLDSFPLMFQRKYDQSSVENRETDVLSDMIKTRIETSMDFPNYPSRDLLANMRKESVKWFVVDLGNTTLRDWEPWATTRFMNEKVAILELAQAPVPSN